MKYYLEKTMKVYDTVEELQKAEKEYDEAHAAEIAKKRERKARAEEINEARKELVAAQKRYNDLINKFIKDYGSYHATYTDTDVDESLNTLENIFLKLLGL